METHMADEKKVAASSETKPAQDNRPKPNRNNNSRYKGNRPNNRPDNRPANRAPNNAPAAKANHFEVTAAYHTERANFWRRRVNGFSMFALIYGVLVANNTAAFNTQFIAGLGLIAFTLVFLIVFAARNYLDHKVNIDANKYRSNILRTADDMAKATKDPVTKEELMLQALTSIGSSDNK